MRKWSGPLPDLAGYDQARAYFTKMAAAAYDQYQLLVNVPSMAANPMVIGAWMATAYEAIKNASSKVLILETGTGLSTIMMQFLLNKLSWDGLHFHAEHNGEWLQTLRSAAPNFAGVTDLPYIMRYPEFWQTLRQKESWNFEVVALMDGDRDERTNHVYRLAELVNQGTVFFDDANRQEVQRAAEWFQIEKGGEVIDLVDSTLDEWGRYAIMWTSNAVDLMYA